MWLAPLACYLASVALALSTAAAPIRKAALAAAPPLALLLLLGLGSFLPQMPMSLWVGLNLVGTFSLLVGWDAWLQERRPRRPGAAFGCWVLAGAFAGAVLSLIAVAIFNPAAAPLFGTFPYRLVFDWPVPEYPLLVVATGAILYREPAGAATAGWMRGSIIGGYLTAVVVILSWVLPISRVLKLGLFLGCSVAATRALRPGKTLAVALTMIVLAKAVWDQPRRPPAVYHERTAFGQLRVEQKGSTISLRSGETQLGSQPLECVSLPAPASCSTVLGYYASSGPAGRVIAAAREPGRPLAVGVIGLGPGMLAAHTRTGDSFTAFEQNRSVIGIAERYFSYLEAARRLGVHVKLEAMDARAGLRSMPAGAFDVLIIDAVAAQLMPMHLLTVEAIDQYPARAAIAGRCPRISHLKPVLHHRGCSAHRPRRRGPDRFCRQRSR